MRKIINAIAIVLFIFFACVSCASKITEKFFQKDIGDIVIGEVNLNLQVDSLFEQMEEYVPDTNKAQFKALKTEFMNNQKVKKIIGESSQQMVNDIVSKSDTYQDMNIVLQKIIFSYDKQFKEIFSPLISVDQIHTYTKEVLNYLPMQDVYNEAVQSFKENLSSSYITMLKVLDMLAQPIVFHLSWIMVLLMSIVLILVNRKNLKWLLPIGTSLIIVGIIQLLMGIAVPTIYQDVILKLDSVMSVVTNHDFHLINIYGLCFIAIGATAVILYYSYTKNNNRKA